MTSEPGPPSSVGQQLKNRREQLDLTQAAVAGEIGVTVNAVSNSERDQSEISRGNRPRWEKVLRLKPGTISRAYTNGTPIEPVGDDTSVGQDHQEPPGVDMTDPKEKAIWEMTALSEAHRLEIIRAARVGRERIRNGDTGSGGSRLA